jgi:two-component system response regulator AtoC
MNKKILIVDDEYLIRFTLSATFAQDHTQVTTVATGNEALREIKGLPYDLCILDLHLPDANGIDLMKTVLTVSPKTKIIIITGYDLDDESRRSLLAQGCGFLLKPFALDEITMLADNLLGNRNDPMGTVA